MDREASYRNGALALIAALLLFRVLTLVLSPTGLHGDEAQYWAWSRDLDAGYYSKPPLIAWVIAGTTALFGQSEWAVRLASPFLHAAAALFVFLAARRLYDARTGLWASALYALMPGVTLSSAIISTDALLLCFVSLATWLWARLQSGAGWATAAALGVALGLGLLAKYAMIYAIGFLLLGCVLHRPTRAALLSKRGLLMAIVASVVVAPNLIWNAQHSFATLSHTGDNANLSGGAGLYPGEWLEFFGGQFGVFGPVSFLALLFALVWGWRRGGVARALAAGVLLPLIVISVQALLSRANANWAAAAYGIAPVLLAAWAVRGVWRRRLVGVGIAVNLVLAVVPPLVLLSPTLTDQLGFANSVKRQRGWDETVARIDDELARGDYAAVAVDQRLMFYDLLYYRIEDSAPLRMWRYEPVVSNHAELTFPLNADTEPVLLVSYYFESYDPFFRDDFDTLTVVRDVTVPLGGGKVRRLRFYRGEGYRGPRERIRD